MNAGGGCNEVKVALIVRNRVLTYKVRAVLRGVGEIYSTLGALSAVFKNGTVVPWGHKYGGGECIKVKAALRVS